MKAGSSGLFFEFDFLALANFVEIVAPTMEGIERAVGFAPRMDFLAASRFAAFADPVVRRLALDLVLGLAFSGISK